MEKVVTVKPLGGYVITDPATMQPLPEAGAQVVWSNYWQRRQTEGVVQVVETIKKGAK